MLSDRRSIIDEQRGLLDHVATRRKHRRLPMLVRVSAIVVGTAAALVLVVAIVLFLVMVAFHGWLPFVHS